LCCVEESTIKFTYKLGVGFEQCEDKGEKRAPKFVPTFNYHKEEKTIKSTKPHYPSSPKPSFKPKRDVKKETSKLRDEAFVCMFCGRAGYFDEFCFRRKRIKKSHFDYARNSYCYEFSEFSPHSYSHASPRTSSHALSHFSQGPNHRSYDFGSRENSFLSRCFGSAPRPHCDYHFPQKPSFPAGGSCTHPESRHLDDSHFSHRDTRPIGPSDEVLKTVKTS
jgi:hypothetical protein